MRVQYIFSAFSSRVCPPASSGCFLVLAYFCSWCWWCVDQRQVYAPPPLRPRETLTVPGGGFDTWRGARISGRALCLKANTTSLQSSPDATCTTNSACHTLVFPPRVIRLVREGVRLFTCGRSIGHLSGGTVRDSVPLASDFFAVLTERETDAI